MSEIINYTRLTTSDKINDKFVTCQVYIPQDRDQAEKGQIFSHIEILSPWFPTSQIGQTIINTLIKEYYKGNDSSELVNFEEAIKKVNEVLAGSAQNGETEWIGKLSGVLVMVNKSEIHFAQTGKSHSYLYRSGKVNHITEGLESEEAPHPLKTFSNLTSGTLSEDDKVIIANDTFFEVINPNELKMIVSSLPPSGAAIESAKILQNHGTQDANAIFLELTTKEKLANLPPEQKVEAVYLDQQILTLSAMSKNALSNVGRSIGKIFRSSSKMISDFSVSKVAPLAKKGIEYSKEKSAQAFERTKQISKPSTENESIDDEKFEEKKENTKNKTGFIKKFQNSIVTSLLKAKNKVRRFLIQIGLYTRKKSKMYLGLLIVVALALGLIIFFSLAHKKNNEESANLQSTYNQIVALSGQADVLVTSNAEEALGKYDQVLTLYQTLKGTKISDQAKPLADKASSQIDSISKLAHIDAARQTNIKDAGAITINDKNIFAISGSDLLSKKIGSGEFNKTATLGGSPSNLTYFWDPDLIAALSNNKIISFDSTGNNLNSSSFTFNAPQILKTFGSNLYVIDSSDSLLYKVPYSAASFGDKSSYFKDQVDINSLVDFAIDGSVYTLSNKGLVARYSRGAKLNDSQIALPGNQKIGSYFNLLTTESSLNLIAAVKVNDAYRLIELRKNGDFVKQYALNGIEEIKSIANDQTNSRIFVLSKDKVFEFKID